MNIKLIQLNKLILGTLGLLLIPFFGIVDAASNPNLYVSAENPYFRNHFAGSMVIEVMINDLNLSDTDESKGEPDVTINGKDLRMVQASDGKWYAYFANVNKAKIADQIAFETGVQGKGLDFGVFCGRDTTSLGPSFSNTDGIAIPRTMTGSTNGNAAFNTCTGSPSGAIINNVVKNPRSINTNPAVPTGQIGLNENAWPLIQLFSFSGDVTIRYNAAGGSQQVTLKYDDIPNISISLDRATYPPGSDVLATIYDMQLNQDPTMRDSWTFNVGSPQATFYAAFTESGSNAANGGAGLVNLASKLASLGFNKNGKISMNLGPILALEANGYQSNTASDGTTTYNQIITFVESQPNTGIFENFDFSNDSNIKVLSTAPRGQSASINYNSKSTSIVSGLGTASIGLGQAPILAGYKIPVTVTDPDQNINSASKDSLDVFRSSAIIPSLKIGNPITLQTATSVKIANSTDPLTGGTAIPSTIDTNSDRMLLDTRSSAGVSNQIFEKIFLNLGVNANQLQELLINVAAANNFGTNWVNYDFRSLQNQLGISDFSDTSISISFGLTDPTPVTLISVGGMTGAQGLIKLEDTTVASIASKSGQAFLVINFDASNNSIPQGIISNESDRQPIVFDLFSFGTKNKNDVNNAIYRFELEETSSNSGVFSGSMEYLIANQLNQYDENAIRSLRTISDDVKFFVNQRLIDEKGINIAYDDISKVGVTEQSSTKTNIMTHTGKVSLDAKTFRFGQPVTVILNDPDLNTKHDTIEIYSVIDNPASQNVDTIGTTDGGILLEVLIKDIRYKRCTINGVEYGGLAATGFSLVETGPNTGVFQGVFKMPSQICDKSGTKLISSAGGIIDLKYHDFRDASGRPNIFGLGDSVSKPKPPTTPAATKTIPSWIKNNAKWWSSGIVSDNEFISAIEYLSKERIIIIKKTQTLEESKTVPPWIKNSAKWWADGLVSDKDFIRGLEYLANKGIIRI